MNISKKFSLKNKIAIITGGNGLLGSTYSYGLHEVGAKIIVLDKIIFSSSSFFILFQHGVVVIPIFFESSEIGTEAFF